jgi:hypothetical protein
LPKENHKPRALLKSWYAITVKEIFAYIGIRVYMGLYLKTYARDYWAQGTNKPIYPLKEIISRERYKAIYARIRLAIANPKVEFEAMFKRVNICPKYPTNP